MRWTEAQVRKHLKKMGQQEKSKPQAPNNLHSAEVKLQSACCQGDAFIIPLPPVTKKNHNNLVDYGAQCPLCKRRQYSKVLPSTQFATYKEDIEPYMVLLKSKVGYIDYPVNLKCIFYCNVKRKSDLVGYIQSIQDIMTDYGVISDDNRDVVASIDGSRVLYDKDNPRTEITITKLSDYDTWTES